MAKRNLSEFFDDGLEYEGIPSSKFPDGKSYRVASPDAKVGLWLQSMAELATVATTGANLTESARKRLILDDDEERNLYERVLGATWDEMLEDGVAWMLLQKIGQDAYIYFAMSEQHANAALERLGEGRARPANRATRRTAKKTAGSKSKKASGATRARTRARASTPSSTSPSEPEAAEQA